MNSIKAHFSNLNSAIEEAIEFGFTKQLFLINGTIKKLLSNHNYIKEEFAVVKSYVVNTGKQSRSIISYIVLNDGTLGYTITSKKSLPRRKLTIK